MIMMVQGHPERLQLMHSSYWKREAKEQCSRKPLIVEQQKETVIYNVTASCDFYCLDGEIS